MPPVAIAPIPRDRTLVTDVAARLAQLIESGAFAPGQRLPPEHVLTEQFAVSRSVVREAIASMRAEGLVNSRRGSGVYVNEHRQSQPFRISLADVDTVPSIVQVLELRAAVEIEAAGLAARRRSPQQAADVSNALRRIDEVGHDSVEAAQADLHFHQAIADATGNAHFSEFLNYIRGLVIPRQRVRIETQTSLGSDAYLQMLQREHCRIEQAIAVGDEVGARDAMRDHLIGSAQRYQRWASEARAQSES